MSLNKKRDAFLLVDNAVHTAWTGLSTGKQKERNKLNLKIFDSDFKKQCWDPFRCPVLVFFLDFAFTTNTAGESQWFWSLKQPSLALQLSHAGVGPYNVILQFIWLLFLLLSNSLNSFFYGENIKKTNSVLKHLPLTTWNHCWTRSLFYFVHAHVCVCVWEVIQEEVCLNEPGMWAVLCFPSWQTATVWLESFRHSSGVSECKESAHHCSPHKDRSSAVGLNLLNAASQVSCSVFQRKSMMQERMHTCQNVISCFVADEWLNWIRCLVNSQHKSFLRFSYVNPFY